MSNTTTEAQVLCYACCTSSDPTDFCPAHMHLDYRGIQDSTGRRLAAILELGRVRDVNAMANLRRYIGEGVEQ